MYVRGYLQGSENGRVVTMGTQLRLMFSYEVKPEPIYGIETNIKWLDLIFHGSGHQQIILHLNKITECLKMTAFKIVFTFDVFLVLKPHALQGDMYFI